MLLELKPNVWYIFQFNLSRLAIKMREDLSCRTYHLECSCDIYPLILVGENMYTLYSMCMQ